MKANMGSIDRIIRVVIAAVIAGLYSFNVINGVVAIILLSLAGVFVLTSAISFCPLYTLVGVNTCEKK